MDTGRRPEGVQGEVAPPVTPTGRFDVFLSYNSADRPTVARIAELLRRERLEPWLDQWSLTPGSPWQEEIVEGLRASRACAVLVGPAGLGAWAREEMAVAQDLAANDRDFRIFMVLLPGAPELSDPALAFLRTRTWVDLRSGHGGDGLRDLVSAITGTPRRNELVVTGDEVCPYRGLEPFEEEHAEFFFGRESDVATLVDKLKSSRFLAVVSPSGSGKSSLLRAGLLPALRRGALEGSETWSARSFTPGAHPLTVLAAHMARAFGDAPVHDTLDKLSNEARGLHLAASVALIDRPITERTVFVVDQFEELFTLCSDENERRSFLDNLLYAATVSDGRVVVVIGMRADFYHRCAAYPELRILLSDHQFLLGPLDAEGLRQAIEEPARRVGLEVEPGLVETITADVAHRPGSLPLLEHVLLEVWRRRKGRVLSLEAYVASGGVAGALAQRANAIYAGFSPTQQDIARRVMLRLIHPGEGAEDTRRRAEMDELVSGAGERADVEAVVRTLADQRLITTGRDDLSGAPVLDITHEALIRGWPELRGWIDENREALRAQRHLTEAASEWDRRGRRDEDLYSGARLAFWKERGETGLNELERAFLAEGERREARERTLGRRRVRFAAGGVVTAITAVAIVALLGLRGVSDQRDVARSRQLAAEATLALQTDPAEGVRLAAEAYEREPTVEAERALRQAVSTPGWRVKLLRGHEGAVSSAAFSPDGKRIVSGGEDGTVRIWDWAGAQTPVILRGHEGAVSSATFSPDGKRVVSSGEDGTVRIWDLAGGGEPQVLAGHEAPATSAAFSPDGTRVVSAGFDGTVRVWDVTGGEPRILRGHENEVVSAAFSPDGTRVVSAGFDSTIRLWDISGDGPLRVWRGHGSEVTSAAFSSDGRRVVSASIDRTVRVWDVAGGEPTVLGHHDDSVMSAAFNSDGRRVVSADTRGKIHVWDMAGMTEPIVLSGHDDAAWSAAFSPNGKLVVSAGGDGVVRLTEWATGAPTVMEPVEGPLTSAAFSPDGRFLATGRPDGTVLVWNWVDGTEPIELRGHEGPVNTTGFSPDGRLVVSAGRDGTVRVWEWDAGRDPVILAGHQATENVTSGYERDVASAAFSPDGRLVLSAGSDGTVRVWDSTAGAERALLRGDEDPMLHAAFSPDGRLVASAEFDGTVRIWDWATGTQLETLAGQAEVGMTAVAFSPDGRMIASPADDGTVRVWDWRRGDEPTVLRGDAPLVVGATFSPDGRLVASPGDDGTLQVWDWRRGGEPIRLTGHDGLVRTAGFSPDGGLVVSSGDDGTVRVWDCTACQPLPHLIALARSPISP